MEVFGELLERCSEGMSLSRSVVQCTGDLVAPMLGEPLHRRALGDVLSNQSVGVLVRSTLPGSVGSGEVDSHAGRFFDLLVPVELGSVVDGDGEEQLPVGLD